MRRDWDAPDVVSDDELRGVPDPLATLVRVTRLLGGDEFLVLHGGGNTSAKEGERMWVKASGHDMRTITPAGLPEVDRDPLEELLRREHVTDTEMMAGYREALRDPAAPSPTIEAVVHHLLPARFVVHSHADAVVTLTSTPSWVELVREVAGEDVLLAPFLMPGFGLAHHLRQALAEGSPRAIVLRHHGLFTWGDDAREVYERHIAVVERAEELIAERTGVELVPDPDERRVTSLDAEAPRWLGRLAGQVGDHLGEPAVAVVADSPRIQAFLARPDLASVTQRGTASLEHVIHTKRVPMIGTDIDAYAAAYRGYVAEHRHRAAANVRELDPAPRVALLPGRGIVGLGADLRRAGIALDIYRHTARIIEAAEALGGYTTVTPAQAFDIEYWELEQAKLR